MCVCQFNAGEADALTILCSLLSTAQHSTTCTHIRLVMFVTRAKHDGYHCPDRAIVPQDPRINLVSYIMVRATDQTVLLGMHAD